MFFFFFNTYVYKDQKSEKQDGVGKQLFANQTHPMYGVLNNVAENVLVTILANTTASPFKQNISLISSWTINVYRKVAIYH